MKRLLSLVSALFFTLSLASCGDDTALEVSESSEKAEVTEVTEKVTEETTTKAEDTTEQAEKIPELQECHKTIRNEEKPEVTLFSFEGKCARNIKAHAKVTDIFNNDYQHNSVVGLIGVPFELYYDEEVTEPKITFTYDTDELRGVPETNLIMLHYNTETYSYDVIESELDMHYCTVSAEISEKGVYMLVDAYQWYSSSWGVEFPEYAYEADKKQYKTDWERENDTADIMRLVDKDWAMENAPEFSVSSPEQLASVVWYVNGIDGEAYITLEDDIDLSDYEWKSMGWDKQAFSGWIDGQNHTINGLSIHEDYCDTGFVGYGLGVSMYDINFTNADISATGCVGIAGGEIYGRGICQNVNVSGNVKGGKDDYASIIGREGDMTFKNCTTEALVNGEPFEYFSYREKRIADVGVIDDFHITLDEDTMIVSRNDPDGDWLNLCWNVYYGDEQREYTGANDKMSFDVYNLLFREGSYQIYLTAYINGAYVKVSNVIEYESAGYEFRWSE